MKLGNNENKHTCICAGFWNVVELVKGTLASLMHSEYGLFTHTHIYIDSIM